MAWLRSFFDVVVAVFAVVVAVFAVVLFGGLSLTVDTETAYGYDTQPIARVDVRVIGAVNASQAQLSDGLEGSASPAVEGRSTSTTPVARSVATNTVDDVIGAVCSFSTETRVLMADGTTRPISQIEVGDEVLAYDPETGERGPRKVTHLWVHEDALLDLEIGGAIVATTEDHPFWNDTDRRWERADALDPGDLVLSADGGRLEIGGFDWSSARLVTAYNLTVDGIHTYFVRSGTNTVLVHNQCPVPGNPFTGANAPDLAYQHLNKAYGLDSGVASSRLHLLKQRGGLGATDDVIIGRTGDVYEATTGEWLGTLTDKSLGG